MEKLLKKCFNFFKLFFEGCEKIKTFDKTDIYYKNNDECVICFYKFNEINNISLDKTDIYYNIKIAKLSCKHIFHIECIKNWMNVKYECPVCCKKINPSFLNIIENNLK